jgi:hypothetical protein
MHVTKLADFPGCNMNIGKMIIDTSTDKDMDTDTDRDSDTDTDTDTGTDVDKDTVMDMDKDNFPFLLVALTS